MATVYVETTIPSYLAAYPSRDLLTAAHQQITHDWWRDARERFDLHISEAVLAEIREGDPDAIARRMEKVKDLPVLQFSEEVEDLASLYGTRLSLPERAKQDLAHVAFAVAYRLKYLVTWNCAHIANGEVIEQIQEVNREIEAFMPLILTPEELMRWDEEKTNDERSNR
jgi:hypothetical protein